MDEMDDQEMRTQGSWHFTAGTSSANIPNRFWASQVQDRKMILTIEPDVGHAHDTTAVWCGRCFSDFFRPWQRLGNALATGRNRYMNW